MENQNTNTKNQQESDIIDIRELLKKYLKKWYWFVISVGLCLVVAFVILRTEPVKFKVETSILLRKSSTNFARDAALMEAIGIAGVSKEVEDEIQILTSKTLMREVIDTLKIKNEYYVKTGWKYEELYRHTPIVIHNVNGDLNFNDTISRNLTFTIKKHKKGFRIDVEDYQSKTKHIVESLSQPINTPAGTYRFEYTDNPFDENATYRVLVNQTTALVNLYNATVSVGSTNKKSNAISISTNSACVEKTIDVLNTLVHLYNLDGIEDKNLIALNTKNFIDSRIQLIEKDLFSVEKEVETYKKENQLTDIKTDAKLYLESSSVYERQRVALETQLNLVNYMEEYIKDDNRKYELIPSGIVLESKTPSTTGSLSSSTFPSFSLDSASSKGNSNADNSNALISATGINDANFRNLVKDYNELVLERMKLIRTTNGSNPVITQLNQQLDVLRKNVLMSIGNMKQTIKISLNDAIAKENSFKSKIREIPTQERQYMEIKRQQEIKEELFLFLLQKQEETALTLASTTPSAKTLDKAYASPIPVSPKKSMILLFALIIGAILPIIVIYIIDIFDNKINDRAELKKILLAPYLGSIGLYKGTGKIVIEDKITTPVAEMFRQVRSNLQFMLSGNKEASVILVTSTISGEGKSFVSINLAASLALTKKKTVLVGLDIRSPKLRIYLDIPYQNGLTIYLSDDKCELDEITYKLNGNIDLDVIPTGPIPPNPSELLMSDRLGVLFEQLREKYDYIIVDSAPVGIISDTYTVNKYVDTTVFVVREKYTSKEVIDNLNEIYETKRLNNVAVVYNGTEDLAYGYGYGNYFKSNKK